MRRLFGLVLAGSVALALSLSLPVDSAGAQQAAERRLPRVTVLPAAKREIVVSVSATGSLIAREEVLVTPQVDGLRIETLAADVGDRVEKGQVLATLDKATIEAEIAQQEAVIARAKAAITQADAQIGQANAQVLQTEAQIAQAEAQIGQTDAAIAQAEATLSSAGADLKRGQTLRKSGTLSAQAVEQRQTAAATAAAQRESALAQKNAAIASKNAATAQRDAARAGTTVAEADVTSAEAQLKSLKLRLARTEIVAPASGVVATRKAQVGAIASAAGGAMFTIIADGEVEMRAEVIETALPQIEAGDEARVTVAGLGEVKGKVRLVSPEVDVTSRLGSVRIALEGDAKLRVGAFARAVVTVDRHAAVVVPVTAVLNDEKLSFVQVLKDGAIETREVTTGTIDGPDIEIVKGVEVGDVVLARAGAFFQTGDKVIGVPPEGADRTAEAAR